MRTGLGVPHDQRSSLFYAHDRNECNSVPKALPIEYGITMNLRSIVIPHKLEASTGIKWRSTKPGRLAVVNARVIRNLVSARVPKYTAIILFLEVNAHILRRNGSAG